MHILNKSVAVAITYKNMKTVRLRVYPSQEVRLSVPFGTSEEWIRCFLDSKQNWLEEKLQHFQNAKPVENSTIIHSGSFTCILGKEMIIRVYESNRKNISVSNGQLLIATNTPDDLQSLERQFDKWMRTNAKQCFAETMEYLYPVIGLLQTPLPRIAVKKMRTLWGSCSRSRNIINLNLYLYQAPLSCVEYVILHELTHLLYPYHDQEFYGFLSRHMPDWKERRKVLKKYQVNLLR